MPPIQPIKATDTDEAARSKSNSAIARINEIDNTAADIAAFASSASASARRAGVSRDEARDHAENARQASQGVTEARDDAERSRVAAETARNDADIARNQARDFKDAAEEFRDESVEAREAAAISRGASHASAAAAQISANDADADRQAAEAARIAAEAAENSLLKWRGPWATLARYTLGDIAQIDGTSYTCVAAHVAGAFASDLAAGRWQVFAQRGASGPGSGDMNASVYDPRGLARDAFSMANMSEGTSEKIMTAAERSKLAGVQAGAQVNAVRSVAGRTGDVALVAGDVAGVVRHDAAQTLTGAQQQQARANIGAGVLAGLDIAPVSAGGTGAQDPAGARANLGIGTLATINLNGDRGVVITGAGGHGFRELIADYLGVNEVGSLAYATQSQGSVNPGQLVSGGSLRASGTQSNGDGSGVAMALGGNYFSGTWRCLGWSSGVPGNKEGASLFMKVGY